MGRNLVDAALLSAKEKAWLDAYHAEVRAKVGPLVAHDARAAAWLQRECAPL